MQLLRCLGVAVLVLLLAGCHGSGSIRDAGADRSLVYAYFDFSDGDLPIDWVRLQQLDGPAAQPPIRMRLARNPDNRYGTLVWYEDLGPGVYHIAQVGGDRKVFGRTVDVTVNLGEPGANETAVRIDRPGVYFLGAWRYRSVPGIRWSPLLKLQGKFQLSALKSPTPATLLKQLLERAEGSNWEPRIRRQLQGGAV